MIRMVRTSGAASILVTLLGTLALITTYRLNAGEPEKAPKEPALKDPFKDDYASYVPVFVRQIQDTRHGALKSWKRDAEKMKLSEETSFYTEARIPEQARANALVLAGIEKEKQGQYRDALKVYRELFERILNKEPNLLYRVSKHGVFVPVAQYVQRRILNFPKEDKAFYRTLYDAKAREAFEQARRNYSLMGLASVADTMMATSYGDNAMLELGNAALDIGHYLESLEYYTTIRDYFPDSDCRTPELDLRIAYCQKMLGGTGKTVRTGKGKNGILQRLEKTVAEAKYTKPRFHRQRASAPHLSADDYSPQPPTTDPLGLTPPVWKKSHPNSRRALTVYGQPVVTKNSVIYRHKNIVYCRSLLNGELRWTNDMGGRATWQNSRALQFTHERAVVQDGLVFLPMYKIGPSLVALDETTGQLKWAYGPLAASTTEEARMRLASAPAGGPRAVYAGYILDHIEGATHTDTEYGVIAFDSVSGRILWRSELCRLPPGKFISGFSRRVRNRIRSFSSPPLYHQGTIYHTTNAGVIAAMDARSGRVKWLMRYPCFPGIHDATRRFYSKDRYFNDPRRSPSFWYNQRPLIVGERLYVLPVDTNFMLCLDRRTGKAAWNLIRPQNIWNRSGIVHPCEATYFLGPRSNGELVFVYSGRHYLVQTVDPKTGKVLWRSPEFIMRDNKPVMVHAGWEPRGPSPIRINGQFFRTGARPYLTTEDKLHIPSYSRFGVWWWGKVPALCNQHTVMDLNTKKVLDRRRHYDDFLVSVASRYISHVAPGRLKELEMTVIRDKKLKNIIRMAKEISEDTPPTNKHGPFLPFSRITFNRHGVQFELRMSARDISMVYDLDAVRTAVSKGTDAAAIFAQAELAFAESRYEDTAELLRRCTAQAPSEDVDFRASVKQLLFQVHRNLARSAIRAANPGQELEQCLGMSRTAMTVGQEIETLFAVAEAFERKGDRVAAARNLRSIISNYGEHEYPVPSVLGSRSQMILKSSGDVLKYAQGLVKGSLYERHLAKSAKLVGQALPLYASAVTPLPRDLTVRAGELAAAGLIRLQKNDSAFQKKFEAAAESELKNRAEDEQLFRLWEFPGTEASRKTLNGLLTVADNEKSEAGRKKVWRLVNAARICGFPVPEALRKRMQPQREKAKNEGLNSPFKQQIHDLGEGEGTFWLVLERRGDRSREKNLCFIGGRVKKRLDNKFILNCLDLNTGKNRWSTGSNIRLRGLGKEPGFHEAYVHGDRVIVHGLYDVLAYSLAEGKLIWRYRVPFDFEIKHSEMSGDLLVLAGSAETVALHVPTSRPDGEVAWQVKEEGDLYIPPYFVGDRLVSVRKLPFNLTVRYRTTGSLMGRLTLPDLSLYQTHPIFSDAEKIHPSARHKHMLVLSDGNYYIMLDTEKMTVSWKRLIDENDITREAPLRFALGEKYMAVLKQDYTQKGFYLLSSETGRVLWRYDPQNEKGPQPMHSVFIDDEKIYGIGLHPDRGFYLVGRECKSGKLLFNRKVEGFQARPRVKLLPQCYGNYLVVRVQDRQNFELKVFDISKKAALVHTHKRKGVGPFGVHGRVSTTIQDGRSIFLSKSRMTH